MTDGRPDDPSAQLGVGAAAARLGVAPETLRSWGRRYGLVPSGRTDGGHRRYDAEDLARLVCMQRLVAAGASPAEAARRVLAGAEDTAAGSEPGGTAARPPRAGAGGTVLAMPGAPPEARGLARAAARLDAGAVHAILGDLLVARGTIATWDTVLRPVLVAAGVRWEQTGAGIDVEHLLSEAVTETLRAHRACQSKPEPGRGVLLTSPPGDWHVLPLHVLAAALAERRVPAQVLGQLPVSALVSAVRRTGASGVFIWSQRRPVAPDDAPPRFPVDALPTSRTARALVAGGPGWADSVLDDRVAVSASLADAVDLLAAAPR
ncbi:MerR family transcriptional regulator [Modestobacter sp. VKM Ac-2986]|uniref:MerR family transcriptional regulator n=1 Tax=Modestobacter sp. VKM Ac-2986 TaxID=3004140 RepID=UPI0022AAF606|nr:MerR family transcriptional regulator [Modestobacter sp. VKM Ac-2986]MCZ2829155.1 MerR family transcriptional regulator [Modestobacter sp. VKM Ac-2986]